jgi:hypothetical protein
VKTSLLVSPNFETVTASLPKTEPVGSPVKDWSGDYITTRLAGNPAKNPNFVAVTLHLLTLFWNSMVVSFWLCIDSTGKNL